MSKHHNILKISMEEEVNKEAERLEQEIASNPELRNLKVTEEMDQRMMERIREYEASKTRYKRKTVFHNPKLWVALVAVFVLVLAMGITSMSEKSYWKKVWDTIWGNDRVTFIDVEEMDVIKSEDGDGATIYHRINDTFKINVVEIEALPKDFVVDSYLIDEGQGLAKVFYLYKDELIRYFIYINSNDSSYARIDEDERVDVFMVKNSNQTLEVEEYDVPNKEKHRYVVNFEYGGIRYQISGIMEREDIKKIIENLKYL